MISPDELVNIINELVATGTNNLILKVEGANDLLWTVKPSSNDYDIRVGHALSLRDAMSDLVALGFKNHGKVFTNWRAGTQAFALLQQLVRGNESLGLDETLEQNTVVLN